MRSPAGPSCRRTATAYSLTVCALDQERAASRWSPEPPRSPAGGTSGSARSPSPTTEPSRSPQNPSPCPAARTARCPPCHRPAGAGAWPPPRTGCAFRTEPRPAPGSCRRCLAARLRRCEGKGRALPRSQRGPAGADSRAVSQAGGPLCSRKAYSLQPASPLRSPAQGAAC